MVVKVRLSSPCKTWVQSIGRYGIRQAHADERGETENEMNNRFEIEKGHGKRCAWVVEDRNAPKAEDAVLYFFATRAKAEAFRAMMIAEHGNSCAPKHNPA